MTARKRMQKDTADSDTSKNADISEINDVVAMEAELAKIHERESTIREHAKGMLDDSRNAVENAVNEYNKLMEVAGVGGAKLSIHEENDEHNPYGDKKPHGAAMTKDTGSDTDKPEKPAKAPSRAAEGHVQRSGATDGVPDDEKPLNPDAVSFADKDGVVVDDPTTSDGTNEVPDKANDDDTTDDTGIESDDDNDDDETKQEFDFLGE